MVTDWHNFTSLLFVVFLPHTLGLVCAKCFKLSKPAHDSWHFLFCKCLSHKGLGINIPYLCEGNDGEDNNARLNLERCWENDETELAPLGRQAARSRDFVMYTLE